MIKTTKEKVKFLLTKYPVLRDNNQRLYLNYLALCQDINVEKVTVQEFFANTDFNVVATMETVTRCSRQLQERNENLRGAEWHLRQKHQKKVKKDLGYAVD